MGELGGIAGQARYPQTTEPEPSRQAINRTGAQETRETANRRGRRGADECAKVRPGNGNGGGTHGLVL